MNKLIFAVYLILTSASSLSAMGNPDSAIVIGTRHQMHSAVLNETRPYWIYLPPDYQNKKYAPAQYPVVYLLDGDTNFHSFTGSLQALAKGPYSKVPQMIVVGILNTDRTRDLTPTPAGRVAYFDNNKSLYKNSGGSSAFIHFLEKELIPHIDSAYRTDSYKMLIGHSFGGLTTVDALLHHTALFNAYVAIDPSLWWDEEILLKQATQLIPGKDFKGKILFAARAQKDPVPQDTTTDMARSNQHFESILSTLQPRNLKWKYVFYPSEDHGTISAPAQYDALKYIFKSHQIHVKQAVDHPELVTKAFEQLSTDLNHKFKPAESWLDWMASYCLSIQKVDQAIAYLHLNIAYYPQSVHAHTALAEAYKKAHNNKAAENSRD